MTMLRKIFRKQYGARSEQGQSLVETAVALPLVLGVAFNMINIGYFWFMVLALSAAPRHGVQYASQGGQASGTVSAPGTAAIKDLVYENLTNAIHGATTSNASVRVCTIAKGVTGAGASQVAQCDSFGPAFGFSAITADPEAPVYGLNRVDVKYTVTPIIQG